MVAVIVRIHWQALRLWLKRVPFYGKRAPAQEAQASNRRSSTHSLTHDEET
jgi:uncharacterized protein